MTRAYPAGHPLRSAQLKIKRAHVHINALKLSIRRLFDAAVTVSEKDIRDGPLAGGRIATITIEPRMRDTWGLQIGDVVSNLRAALDHVAWALAQEHLRNTGGNLSESQERRIQFPLAETPEEFFDKRRGQIHIKFVLPSARERIQEFQPYNRRNRPELYLLGVLRNISDVDKHRVVTQTWTRAKVRLTDSDTGVIMNLNKKGDAQFFIEPSDVLKPQITFEIAAYTKRYPSIYGIVTADTLLEIHNLVRDKVVPSFACFFK